MHKDFYASGFLYHPLSEQILLQQKTSNWSLLGKNSPLTKSGEETFKDLFLESLNLKIKLENIKVIYSYSSKEISKDQYVYYAEVSRLYRNSLLKDTVFEWFTFKQIQKINLSEQTRQDITIGQRVIDSSIRKGRGEKTIG